MDVNTVKGRLVGYVGFSGTAKVWIPSAKRVIKSDSYEIHESDTLFHGRELFQATEPYNEDEDDEITVSIDTLVNNWELKSKPRIAPTEPRNETQPETDVEHGGDVSTQEDEDSDSSDSEEPSYSTPPRRRYPLREPRPNKYRETNPAIYNSRRQGRTNAIIAGVCLIIENLIEMAEPRTYAESQ